MEDNGRSSSYSILLDPPLVGKVCMHRMIKHFLVGVQWLVEIGGPI
jgi:hypothetical protein